MQSMSKQGVPACGLVLMLAATVPALPSAATHDSLEPSMHDAIGRVSSDAAIRSRRDALQTTLALLRHDLAALERLVAISGTTSDQNICPDCGDDQARRKYQWVDGEAVVSSRGAIDVADGYYVFVETNDKKIHLTGPLDEAERAGGSGGPRWGHSTNAQYYTSGQVFAGEMYVASGALLKFTACSGHALPDEDDQKNSVLGHSALVVDHWCGWMRKAGDDAVYPICLNPKHPERCWTEGEERMDLPPAQSVTKIMSGQTPGARGAALSALMEEGGMDEQDVCMDVDDVHEHDC